MFPKEHRRFRVGAAVLLLAVVGSGCGTRVTRPTDAASSPLAAVSPGAPSSPAVDHGPDPGAVGGEGTSEAASTPPESPASDPPAAGTGARRTTSGAGSAPPPAPHPSEKPVAQGRQGAPSAGQPGGPVTTSTVPSSGAGAGAGAVATERSVVRIGNVGTYSGPAGGTFLPYLHGVQLWVKWVNARGGINGHPVELSVADDSADPARHRAAVQDLVENRRVLAFVGNAAPFSGESTVQYLEAKRIPLVGMSTGESWAYTTPMYFPQATSGPALTTSLYGSFAQQMVPQGRQKLGVMACTEAQLCRDFYDQAEKESSPRGVQVVYKARVSLAQPDFTAECLSAQRAGVEVLFLAADGNSQRRVAASCARQGFRPVFATGAQGVFEDFKDDANLSDSFISNSVTFPVFQSDSPATREFQATLKRYGAGSKEGGVAIGWVAGKLFETAALNIGEPPTTAAILDGLWAMKNDDLGGLTQPLTFNENQNPVPRSCWWNVTIVKNKWVSPDDYRRTCE